MQSSYFGLNFAFFSIWNHKKITCFLQFELCFETGYILSFLAYNTLRAIVALFFSNLFYLSFFDGKFIPSNLYLFTKGLIFIILSACCTISS